MNLFCVGIDFNSSPLEVRERLNFSREDLDATLARFVSQRRGRENATEEVAILSTCNRVEAYGYLDSTDAEDRDRAWTKLEAVLTTNRRNDSAHSNIGFARRAGTDVVIHLTRVAAGLESMVLGEPQILGQVSGAIAAAVRLESAGPVLEALFQSAVRAGRRARAETAINRKPATVASVAATHVRRFPGDKQHLRVAILGAGSVARILASQFSAEGFSQIAILNRTLDSAEELAHGSNATAHPLEDLPKVLASTEVLITSTSASEPIVSARMVERALASKDDPIMNILDLAVPRDVESSVRTIPGVHLLDLDDLRSEIGSVAEERRLAIPLVEQIIDVEVERFVSWQRARSVAPIIADLRRKAEAIRQSEIARVLQHLPDADGTTKAQLEHLSRTLVNRILHDPTTRLREGAVEGSSVARANTVRHLFNLPPS